MTPNEIAPDERTYLSFDKVTFLLRLLMVVAFLFIGLKIIQYGYIPPGDALRDSAQAMTGKPFKDVIVMFPGYKINHNFGWDWTLRQMHVALGMSEDHLVAFSVVFFLFVLLCAPLPWFRCPEALMAAFLVFMLSLPGLMSRFTQGRPFLTVEAVLIALLLAWHKGGKASWLKIILTLLAFTLAVWIHGSWFLWPLLPLAFLLAGQWRAGITLGFCWVGGTLLGAALTGHPFVLIRQSIELASVVSKEHVATTLTVGELQPSAGEFTTLLLLALTFWWRKLTTDHLVRSPLFWMTTVSWLLGLTAGRFWADWGLPAAFVWFALQIDEAAFSAWAARPRRRLVIGGVLLLGLFLVSTSDMDGRYTNMLRQPFINFSQAELKGWAPDKGGIFYGADMSFFYDTYYTNPEGDWKYIVGFEPAWMPQDDLKVYRDIQWHHYAWATYDPWIKKMRPEDRLEISSTSRPDLPALEWIYAGGNTWVGRLPRSAPHHHGP
jgi:hypothetical protein